SYHVGAGFKPAQADGGCYFQGRPPCRLRHHQKDENAPQLALSLALSRRERGTVGMREGNTYALARAM
ncbi:MAG: hypothetical protein M1551_06270, partial [Firmicutes bacterium]|nr:hypothetical protein [Bacillota bacterium]